MATTSETVSLTSGADEAVSGTPSQITSIATNTTAASTGYTPYRSRPFEEVMVIILIIISAYLTVSAFWYLIKHGQTSLRWTNLLCFVAPVTLLVQCCLFVVEVFPYPLTDGVCQAYVVLTLNLLVFNKSFVYLVLWMRQQSFLKNPQVVHSSSKVVFAVSYVTLGAIVVLPVLQVVFEMYGLVTRATPVGCKGTPDYRPKQLNYGTKAAYALYTVFQFVLLGLVLHPIVGHLKRNRSASNAKIQKTVVRLLICTVVCVVSDVGFLVYTIVNPRWASISLMAIVLGFNAVINIVSLYASFTDCYSRMVPFYVATDEKNKEESKSTNVTNKTTV